MASKGLSDIQKKLEEAIKDNDLIEHKNLKALKGEKSFKRFI